MFWGEERRTCALKAHRRPRACGTRRALQRARPCHSCPQQPVACSLVQLAGMLSHARDCCCQSQSKSQVSPNLSSVPI